MEKLIKTGRWLWGHKEPVVMWCLVGVLIFRVYVVLRPTQEYHEPDTVVPRPSIPDNWAEAPEAPPPLPPAFQFPPETELILLAERNPFTIYSSSGPVGTTEKTEKDLPVTLVGIKPFGDEFRADMFVRTTNKRQRLVKAGDVVEGVRVDRIGPDSVEVTWTEENKRFTLTPAPA